MMAALAAGGVELLCDQERPADLHNPRGYFEYQPVLRLHEDASWLNQHGGRAVKIIYRLLFSIPDQVRADVIFMERDLGEVIASQSAMLGDRGRGPEDEWHRLFTRELERVHLWLRQRPQLRVHLQSYAALLTRPREQFQSVSNFLARDLDVDAMAAVVEPSLYRQRRT